MNLSLRMHVSHSSTLGHLHLRLAVSGLFLLLCPRANHQCIISCQTHSEEISRERNERQRLERDLDEASRRLAMAHQDIRRLTNELDAAKNNNVEASGMIQICITKRAVCSYLSIFKKKFE